MDTLHRTEVTPDQIDHLGHMNVRFYGEHARTGAAALLASIGLRADDERAVLQRDTYVRHHREQLVGAPLEVRGGVLDVSSESVRVYEELVNTDTGDVAATFVLAFEAAARSTHVHAPIGDDVVAAAQGLVVAVPEHGRPRSILVDTDPTDGAPTLEVVRGLDLAQRQVRTIDPAWCDEHGFASTLAVVELVWGGAEIPGREFRPLEDLADGGHMGFATMETRSTWARWPEAGDRVQAYGAEVDVQARSMRSRHWVFDVDRGDLIGVFSVVSVAFDLDARRAIVIPDDVRRRLERRLHPELDEAGGDAT